MPRNFSKRGKFSTQRGGGKGRGQQSRSEQASLSQVNFWMGSSSINSNDETTMMSSWSDDQKVSGRGRMRHHDNRGRRRQPNVPKLSTSDHTGNWRMETAGSIYDHRPTGYDDIRVYRPGGSLSYGRPTAYNGDVGVERSEGSLYYGYGPRSSHGRSAEGLKATLNDSRVGGGDRSGMVTSQDVWVSQTRETRGGASQTARGGNKRSRLAAKFTYEHDGSKSYNLHQDESSSYVSGLREKETVESSGYKPYSDEFKKALQTLILRQSSSSIDGTGGGNANIDKNGTSVDQSSVVLGRAEVDDLYQLADQSEGKRDVDEEDNSLLINFDIDDDNILVSNISSSDTESSYMKELSEVFGNVNLGEFTGTGGNDEPNEPVDQPALADFGTVGITVEDEEETCHEDVKDEARIVETEEMEACSFEETTSTFVSMQLPCSNDTVDDANVMNNDDELLMIGDNQNDEDEFNDEAMRGCCFLYIFPKNKKNKRCGK